MSLDTAGVVLGTQGDHGDPVTVRNGGAGWCRSLGSMADGRSCAGFLRHRGLLGHHFQSTAQPARGSHDYWQVTSVGRGGRRRGTETVEVPAGVVRRQSVFGASYAAPKLQKSRDHHGDAQPAVAAGEQEQGDDEEHDEESVHAGRVELDKMEAPSFLMYLLSSGLNMTRWHDWRRVAAAHGDADVAPQCKSKRMLKR